MKARAQVIGSLQAMDSDSALSKFVNPIIDVTQVKRNLHERVDGRFMLDCHAWLLCHNLLAHPLAVEFVYTEALTLIHILSVLLLAR